MRQREILTKTGLISSTVTVGLNQYYHSISIICDGVITYLNKKEK